MLRFSLLMRVESFVKFSFGRTLRDCSDLFWYRFGLESALPFYQQVPPPPTPLAAEKTWLLSEMAPDLCLGTRLQRMGFG